jgi:putative addiction module component (TIGR02574 family)
VRSRAVALVLRIRQNLHVARPALDLANLSAHDKLELIDELWRSLRDEDFPLSDEVRAELDKRLDEMDGDGGGGVSWDDVRAEMVPSRS